MKYKGHGRLALGIIFLVLSFLLLIFASSSLYLGLRSYSWAKVPGKIVDADTYREYHFSSGSAKLSSGGHYQYYLSAKYTYSYEGTEYSSENVTIQGTYYTPYESKRDAYAKEFTADSVVDVFVNQAKPEQSTLVQGLSPSGYVPLMMTAVLFLCGMVMLGIWRYKRRKNP